MTETATGGRLALSRRTALLAVGDAAVIGLFVLLGSIEHGTVAQPARAATTYGTFLAGWLVVAPALGLYATASRSRRATAVRTLAAWVPAVVIVQGLRATAAVPGGPALTFAVVATLVGGASLVGWRLLAGRLSPARE